MMGEQEGTQPRTFSYWVRLGNYSQTELNRMGRDGWQLVERAKFGRERDGTRIYEYTFMKENA